MQLLTSGVSADVERQWQVCVNMHMHTQLLEHLWMDTAWLIRLGVKQDVDGQRWGW